MGGNLGLEALDDFADDGALDAIGLDGDEGALVLSSRNTVDGEGLGDTRRLEGEGGDGQASDGGESSNTHGVVRRNGPGSGEEARRGAIDGT